MSIDDPNAYSAGPPVKQGMGTAAKVLLILACLAGVGVLGCCGFFFFVGYKMKDAFTVDPVAIRERTQAIVEINIPEVLNPDRAMDLLTFMHLVGYSAKGEQAYGNLMMVDINKSVAPNEQTARVQLNAQVEQQMQQLAGNRRAQGGIPERKTTVVTIRGKEVPFDISKFPASDGKPGMVKVSGLFEGKNGYCELLLEATENLLTEKQIDDMLKSIK